MTTYLKSGYRPFMSRVPSPLKLLTRNSDWAIWADKATGTSKGTNSPQVNRIVDLVGTADGTLQGFGFIPTSGYADVVAPNGKTVTGIQGDGVNDVVILPSNAPNPVGLQDFGFAFVFKTGATVPNQHIYTRVNGGESQVLDQISVYVESNTLYLRIGGALILVGDLAVNTFYKLIFKRVSNIVYMKLNLVSKQVANAVSLVSKTHTRIFAFVNNSEGTSYGLFSNVLLLYDNYNNGTDLDAWETDQNKAIAKIYGL